MNSETQVRIAIIGLGEVGRCYASALHAAGHRLQLCESMPSKAALDLASSLDLPIQHDPGSWISASPWVLSCVTGASSLAVAQQLAGLMTTGHHLADFTTASPGIKKHAASSLAERGVHYVDTAIMGSIAMTGVRTPLLAAGHGAGSLKEIIDQAGGRMEILAQGSAGDAISIKVLRSIFTKGMEALSVELLMSAEQQGVRELLYEQLGDIDRAPLRSVIEAMVRTHVVHARRRGEEVQHAQSELTRQGLPSVILPGVEARFQKTAAALASNPLESSDPSIAQALEWLLSSTGKNHETA